MFWAFLLLLVMGLVFFKLGMLTVWFGVFELLAKILFFATGAFLLVAAWKWAIRRRRSEPVRWER